MLRWDLLDLQACNREEAFKVCSQTSCALLSHCWLITSISQELWKSWENMASRKLNIYRMVHQGSVNNRKVLYNVSVQDISVSEICLTFKLVIEKKLLKSVLKRHAQFCLIASLIARVHEKALSLSTSLWHVQPITEQSYRLRIQLRIAWLIIFPKHDFTWITEVESGNAHDLWE